MKQTYVKPKIFVERFSLTQSIAVNCGIPASVGTMGNNLHSDPYSCMWDFGSVTAFMESGTGCASAYDQIAEGEDIDGYCYNNPTADMAVFGSV